MNNKTVCYTGSRPKNLPWGTNEKHPRCVDLKKRLTAEIEKAINLGYTNHIFGMALGIDQIAFETSVTAEVALIFATYNLKRLVNILGIPALIAKLKANP